MDLKEDTENNPEGAPEGSISVKESATSMEHSQKGLPTIRSQNSSRNKTFCKPNATTMSSFKHGHLFAYTSQPKKKYYDPLQFYYALNLAKRNFNQEHKSAFLEYKQPKRTYISSRDEMGGAITADNWNNFMEKLRTKTQKGSKRLKRKRKSVPERSNLKKNDLWKRVFIQEISESLNLGPKQQTHKRKTKLDFIDSPVNKHSPARHKLKSVK